MLLFIIFVLPCDMQEKGFNTSHVVIYQKFTAGLDTSYSGFNTSHVVIYRRSVFPNRTNIFQFQYISCCYLSKKKWHIQRREYVSIHLMMLFILKALSAVPSFTRFNTSHVVIYRGSKSIKISSFRCFNTSHVVIYQKEETVSNKIILFQYISCCYLSNGFKAFLFFAFPIHPLF